MTYLDLPSSKNITIFGRFFHFILCIIIPLFQIDLIPWTFILYAIYGQICFTNKITNLFLRINLQIYLFYKSCGALFFTSLILLNPVAKSLEKLEKNLGQASSN